MEDKYLTVVEEHVDRLGEMAKNIHEELQIQDRMVDDLGDRIDRAQEHVINVNTRMKVSSAICRRLVVDRGLSVSVPLPAACLHRRARDWQLCLCEHRDTFNVVSMMNSFLPCLFSPFHSSPVFCMDFFVGKSVFVIAFAAKHSLTTLVLKRWKASDLNHAYSPRHYDS